MAIASNSSVTCTPRTLKRAIHRAMKVGRPVMITGSPGIGKSDIIAEIGKTTGRVVIDLRLLLCDPTDIKGFPYYCPKTNTMKWAPPGELPNDILSTAILFLDEINAAPPSVQAAAYQLILCRRIGEYVLPDGVSIVAAGNRDTDGGATYKLTTPLASRFVHYDLVVDFEDWFEWATRNGIHPDILGFLKVHPHKLFDFAGTRSAKAYAVPRTWYFASQMLDDESDEAFNLLNVAGCVGEGIAIEFMAHRRTTSKLPLAIDVLTGKVTTLATDDMGSRYTLVMSLCYTLNSLITKVRDTNDKFSQDDWNKCANTFFAYMMENMQHEMCVLAARIAVREFKLPFRISAMPAFTEFTTRYASYIAGA